MRPIIGNRIVIPHIVKRVCVIKRVCINIGDVGAITGGMLRHLPSFAARTVVEEELLITVGQWYS